MSALLATFGASAVGVATTFAASSGSNTSPMQNIVTAIATKFNLNEADVQAVFDAERVAHQAERAEHEAERLTQAVTDGKLTQAQSDAITAKMAEEKAFFESIKDMSDADRKAAFKTHGEEMKAWVTANDIPRQFMPFGRPMHGGREGMHRGKMMKDQRMDQQNQDQSGSGGENDTQEN